MGEQYTAGVLPRGHFLQSSTFYQIAQYPEQYLLPSGRLPSRKYKGVHPFQFNVFRHSLFFKYYFHLLITLIFTAIAHQALRKNGYEFMDFMNGFQALMESGASSSELETYAQGIDEMIALMKQFARVYLTMLFSLSFFFLTDLMLCCLRKSHRSLGVVHVLLGVCFLVTLVGWIKQLTTMKEFEIEFPTALERVVHVQKVYTSDEFKIIPRLMGLTFLTFYSYILFSLRIFSYFSKLTVIITSIFAKLLPFLLLQGAVLYIFTSYVSFSLNEMPVYATEESTFSLLI